MAEHVFTEGEKKCLEEYWRKYSKTPRKNLIKLVSHINMFNPVPNEKSWEYIFFDRQLTDEMVDFALKMKLRKAYYIDELAKREGRSVEDTARMADELVHIGLLEYNCDDDGVQEIPAEDREPEREAERFPLRNATMIRDQGKNHEAVTVMISAGKTSM